jgi:hypothetical protein
MDITCKKKSEAFGTLESVLLQIFLFFLTTILLEFSGDFFAVVLQYCFEAFFLREKWSAV